MNAVTDSLLPLVSALVALGAYLLGRRHGAASQNPAATEALFGELRERIHRLETRLTEESLAKEDAQKRAASAESLHQNTSNHLQAERERHATDLHTLRTEQASALAEVRNRHDRDLAALRESFSKLGTDVLRGMTPDVTREVAIKVEPLIARVQQALVNYQQSLQQGLSGQEAALAQVRTQMEEMNRTTVALATSTDDFTAVLKSSQHRGRWGEQTLRRVVEAAGLSPHCDFQEQSTQDDTRPDLIIRLPAKRCIILDSKVPELDAALAAPSAPNRAQLVREHAEKLRRTIRALSQKNYPAALTREGLQAFEKVILFLPAESLLSTALEGHNDLILEAARDGILLATPATLLGFLAAINLSWQQHQQAENAQHIVAASLELYERVGKFSEHFAKMRKALQEANTHFQQMSGSFNSRVRPQGERLRGLAGHDSPREIMEVPPIESPHAIGPEETGV